MVKCTDPVFRTGTHLQDFYIISVIIHLKLQFFAILFQINKNVRPGSRGSSVSMTRLQVDRPRNRGSLTGIDNKQLLLQSSRLVTGPIQRPAQCAPWAPSPYNKEQ